eukprot:11336516-Alexandrium_andersonii.AAC.1
MHLREERQDPGASLGGATAPPGPRLAPPARAASPGGLPPHRTPPTGAFGVPEAPVGVVRGG